MEVIIWCRRCDLSSFWRSKKDIYGPPPTTRRLLRKLTLGGSFPCPITPVPTLSCRVHPHLLSSLWHILFFEDKKQHMWASADDETTFQETNTWSMCSVVDNMGGKLNRQVWFTLAVVSVTCPLFRMSKNTKRYVSQRRDHFWRNEHLECSSRGHFPQKLIRQQNRMSSGLVGMSYALFRSSRNTKRHLSQRGEELRRNKHLEHSSRGQIHLEKIHHQVWMPTGLVGMSYVSISSYTSTKYVIIEHPPTTRSLFQKQTQQAFLVWLTTCVESVFSKIDQHLISSVWLLLLV